MSKEFLIHCDYCGRKVIIRDPSGINGLKEVPLAPVPGGVPELDVQKKIKTKKSIPRRQMFKCSSCGRGLVVKQSMIPKVEDFKEKISEEENNSLGREGSTFGRQISTSPSRTPFTRRTEIPK